jgi:hypothetical protein
MGKVAKTTSDRQKLLVSVTQEVNNCSCGVNTVYLFLFFIFGFKQFVRHLTDSIRGEYRDRVMVRNAELRMYTIIMTKFTEFQAKVS